MRNKWFWIWFYPRKLENMIQLQSSGSKKKQRAKNPVQSREANLVFSGCDIANDKKYAGEGEGNILLCFPYLFLFCSVLHILCQAGEAFTVEADWCLWNLRENYLSALSAFKSAKQWFSTGKNLRANKENIILGQKNPTLTCLQKNVQWQDPAAPLSTSLCEVG